MPARVAERQETLRIAKRLNKFIPLPSMHNWKVHERDVLQRGRVLCMLRSKRFFFPDDISSLKMRMTTVTRQGYLILYETKDEGLIIDLRSASHVLTECDKYKSKKVKYSRSHIKIRLPRGNVHLYVRDNDIFKWTGALLEAHVSTRPKAVVIRREAVENTVEPVVKVEIEESSECATSNSGLITVTDRSSEDSQIPSIRRGAIPVEALRCKIEQDLKECENAFVEDAIHSMFAVHEGAQSEERPKMLITRVEGTEEAREAPQKWWMRSLRC